MDGGEDSRTRGQSAGGRAQIGHRTARAPHNALSAPRPLRPPLQSAPVVNDIEIATEAARRGSAVLLRHWEQLGKDDADLKARNDWVSRADRDRKSTRLNS